MHPEAEALLNAIYDHPDDDTPRLVYADWLQEHGQENYAQFIRLQCAAAREQLWSAEANRLWEEIGRVWNRLYYEWLPAMQFKWRCRLKTQQLDALFFHRGFLSPRVQLTSEHVAFSEWCWEWLPERRVNVDLTESVDALLASGQSGLLKRISSVRSSEHIQRSDFAYRDALNSFLSQPTLCNVEMLELNRCSLAISTLDVLLGAPNLQRVRRLHVCFATFYEEDEPEFVEDRESALAALRKRFSQVTYAHY